MITGTSTVKEFYNQVYQEGDIRDNTKLYRWIINLISPLASTCLLDVGCGVGCLLYEAKKRTVRVFGLDISHAALVKAKKAIPDLNVCVAYGEKAPFKSDSFDCVVSLGSIEHFPNPEDGIREVARILKPDGRAVLLLPNSFYLGDILQILFTGRASQPWQIQERLLSREEWRLAIEENGLGIEKIYGYNKYPELFQKGTLKLKSIKKYIKVFLMRHLCPFNLSWQFVYICRKIAKA